MTRPQGYSSPVRGPGRNHRTVQAITPWVSMTLNTFEFETCRKERYPSLRENCSLSPFLYGKGLGRGSLPIFRTLAIFPPPPSHRRRSFRCVPTSPRKRGELRTTHGVKHHGPQSTHRRGNADRHVQSQGGHLDRGLDLIGDILGFWELIATVKFWRWAFHFSRAATTTISP